MLSLRLCLCCLFVSLIVEVPAFADNDCGDAQNLSSNVQCLPNGETVTYPPRPGDEISIEPSLWYGSTDRSGPLFKNQVTNPVGLQTSRFSGPIGGFTVIVDPRWSSGWLENISFAFSAYFAREAGSFNAVYFKTVTNDEDNNWSGNGSENSQDYEVLLSKELLPADQSVGSSAASVLALGGLRYIDLETAIFGQDLFQNQLTYDRHNRFYLGEAGLRFVAPLGYGWRLILGGTGLYGTTYDQNGEVCGCGDIERDTRNTRADGYDFYGGISFIPHEMNQNIPEGIALTLRYRDRSLYTEEQRVVGIDHQLGPEFTFAWKFPLNRGE